MDAVGIVFADSYDVALEGIVKRRALAAVPFGGRYRVIDFVMSNMANAGIINVGIIVTQKYRSLVRHLRGGEDWDLNRKRSGVAMLTPFSFEGGGTAYKNRLEALQANITYLRETDEKYVLMTSCNYVGNIDFEKMLNYHIKSGARYTCMYTERPINKDSEVESTQIKIASDGTVVDIIVDNKMGEDLHITPNAYITDRESLIRDLEYSEKEHLESLRLDLIRPLLRDSSVKGYKAQEPILFLDTPSSYLLSNLALLDRKTRDAIFHVEDRPIATRVKDSAPAKYGNRARTHNSLIADDTLIEGEVLNSIIFRGVHIKQGAKVENSVIMQDSTIGEGAELNYVVLDKNVIVNDGRQLSAYITHPFYLGHRMVI